MKILMYVNQTAWIYPSTKHHVNQRPFKDAHVEKASIEITMTAVWPGVSAHASMLRQDIITNQDPFMESLAVNGKFIHNLPGFLCFDVKIITKINPFSKLDTILNCYNFMEKVKTAC